MRVCQAILVLPFAESWACCTLPSTLGDFFWWSPDRWVQNLLYCEWSHSIEPKLAHHIWFMNFVETKK
jgi:hypothetical protein